MNIGSIYEYGASQKILRFNIDLLNSHCGNCGLYSILGGYAFETQVMV